MKNNRNPLYSAVHYALAAGVVSTLGASNVAFAQDEDVAELERVEVTGSRIRRTDIVGPNPIQVIQREEILETGLVTVGQILENLPIAGSGLNTAFNNGGNGAIFLDLRNLGFNRLLVLVNGRRWITAGTGGAVDLQTIPTAIIERIEILKDGASAIYGSDAISGVVNIITRTDFTGAQASAQYGEYDEGDGEITAANFSIGTAGERTSVFMNVSYVKQEPVFAGARDISKEPLFGTGSSFGSSGSPEGRLLFATPETWFDGPGGTYGEDGDYDVVDASFNEGATFPNGAPASAYRPWTPATDAYNFAPDNYLLTPSQRINLYVQGRHEVTDNIAFFSEVVYNNRQSSQFLAANPLFIGEFFGDTSGTCIDADQQFNPFDVQMGLSCGGVPFGFGRRLLEAGNRIFAQDIDTYQFTGGLQGNFEMMGRYWNWETYYQWSRNERQDLESGEQNVARIQQALLADCSETPGCVPLNLWGGAGGNTAEEVRSSGSGTITPEMVAFINADTNDYTFAERTVYAANLTGSLFDLPAGPVGVAVGYEYRRDKGANKPDYLRVTGQLAGNAIAGTAGSFDVGAAYVEFAIPILADLPLVEVLEASIAARRSDYSNFGTTTNFKFGLRWQPFSDLLLRGTVGEAFRAPSIGELFQGQADSFPTFTDPCSDMLGRAGSDVPGGRDAPQPQNVIDNCVAAGVPASGVYRQVNSQIRITVGGNPDLEPELADTVTFGVVYSPTWFDGFDLTLDYYDYEITNAISNLQTQSIIDGCVIGGNPTLCGLVTRGIGGIVSDLNNSGRNIGGVDTSGVDVGIHYAFPQTSVGFFEVNWDSTYVDEFVQSVPNTVTGGFDDIELTNTVQGDTTFPHWKSNLFLDWSFADWSANYTLRYIGDTEEGCVFGAGSTFGGLCSNAAAGINELETVVYHDAQLSYHFQPWDSRFTVGVRNLTDEDPPVSFTAFANSFQPATYDIPGRFYYGRVTVNF